MKLCLKGRLLFLTAATALQLAVLVSAVTYTARVKTCAVKENRIVSFRCAARDPFNAFKGRYLALRLTGGDDAPLMELDARSFVEFPPDTVERRTVYCCAEECGDGLHKITALRQTLPRDGKLYLKGRLLYAGRAHEEAAPVIDFPFTEYYMQEEYAHFIEALPAHDFSALKPALTLFVDKGGRCIQNALTVASGDGERIKIEEYCKQELRKKQ